MDKRQSVNNEEKVSVANFNVVFVRDKDESPLLGHFDTILMPALKSGVTGSQGDNIYLLMDIEVNRDMDYEHVLTGLIVKSTVLEVKSMFDENGNLVERNDIYPVTPFSTFIIYLKSHRMILIENQEGDLFLDSFRSTIKYVLDIYVVRENHTGMEQEKEQLPIPLVSTMGIPPKGGMIAALKQAEKILTLILRFYPLNSDGDTDLSEMMNGVSGGLRKKIGSDRGSVTYRSPKDINGAVGVVKAVEDTIEPIVVAKYPGRGGESTTKYSEISDRRKTRAPDGERNAELSSMINQGKEVDGIDYTSEGNNKIYLGNQGKIIRSARKER